MTFLVMLTGISPPGLVAYGFYRDGVTAGITLRVSISFLKFS